MPLKTGTIEEPQLNLTPMIDIVFLLIIFFMVGTKFADMDRQYEIELPSVSDAQPLSSLPDELTIDVRRNGDVHLNAKLKTIAELETELLAARENYADQIVVIRGEGEGRYQRIMDVLATCHRAGIVNVSLANRLKTESR